ncbi:hypothetical protein GCM10008922_42710 [Faecalicatena contorta]
MGPAHVGILVAIKAGDRIMIQCNFELGIHLIRIKGNMIILNVPGTLNGLGEKNCLAVIFCRPGMADIVLVDLPGGS